VALPLADAVRSTMPVRDVSADEARALSYGKALDAVGIAGTYGAIGPDGAAVALLSEDGVRAQPVLVFLAAG
jgi:tRNA pseudouridine55 synthase